MEDGQLLGFVADFLSTLDARGTCTELSNALALQVYTMLRPYCRVVDVPSEVTKALNGRRISPGGKPNAGNEPLAIYFTSVRALDKPLVAVLIKDSSIDMLVVGYVLTELPLLVKEIEVSSELRSARIPLFEGKF